MTGPNTLDPNTLHSLEVMTHEWNGVSRSFPSYGWSYSNPGRSCSDEEPCKVRVVLQDQRVSVGAYKRQLSQSSLRDPTRSMAHQPQSLCHLRVVEPWLA
jgi:hypothetical protein